MLFLYESEYLKYWDEFNTVQCEIYPDQILGLCEEKAEENDTFVTQTYLSVAFITFTSSPPPYLDRVVSTRWFPNSIYSYFVTHL